MKDELLVLQVEKRHFVAVTSRGEFLRLPLAGRRLAPGDRVTREAEPARAPRLRWAAALILAAVLAGGLWWSRASAAPAAYLAVDINPSLQLALTARGTVQGAVPLDADGARVLAGLKLAGLSAPAALRSVLERTVSLGYLHRGAPGLVMVSLVSVSPAFRGASVSGLRSEAAAWLRSRGVAAYLVTGELSRKLARQAWAAGMSVNRYYAYLRLKGREPSLTLAAARSGTLASLLRGAGATPAILAGHREDVGEVGPPQEPPAAAPQRAVPRRTGEERPQHRSSAPHRMPVRRTGEPSRTEGPSSGAGEPASGVNSPAAGAPEGTAPSGGATVPTTGRMGQGAPGGMSGVGMGR